MRLMITMPILILLAGFGSPSPADETSPMERGHRALASRDFEGAARNFEQARKAAPRDPEPIFWLARVELRRDNPGAAIDLMREVLKLRDDNAEYHYWYGGSIAENMDNLGNLQKMRQASRMRSAWTRAVELDPKHIPARRALIQYYIQAPRVAGGSRDKAVAEVAAIRALDRVAGHKAMAYIHMVDGDSAKAAAEYLAAVEAAPEDLNLRLTAGFALQHLQDWPGAMEQFGFIVSRDGDHMAALYQVGRMAALSGQSLNEGVDALQRYLKGTPGGNEPPLAWAHIRLGQIFERQDRKEAAREQYESALRLNPEHKEAREALKALGS